MSHDSKEFKTPIHVKTEILGPHRQRVFYLPKLSKNDGKHTTSIWVIAAAFIGVSFFSFITNNIEAMVRSIKNTNSPNVLVLNDTPKAEVPLGSDDAIDLLVTKELIDDSKKGEYYFLKEKYTLPKTTALSYLAGDVETGDIIIEKNKDMILSIASVSKLITALVAKDFLDLHESVTVSKSSIDTYGTFGGLNVGEKILVIDLLYPLLLESSNDAAEVLAEGLGRQKFLSNMNKKASDLGMKKTNFKDPSGLSAENISTAEDLFVLAKYISKNFPELWDITRVRQYGILKHNWINSNRFLQKTSFVGGKNGFTYEANKTTVSVFNVTIQKQKRKIAIVVLKSADREGDTEAILRFLENQVGFQIAE